MKTDKKKMIENRSHQFGVAFNQLSELRIIWRIIPQSKVPSISNAQII